MNKIILILLMFLTACGAAPNPDIYPIKEKGKMEKRLVKPKLIWNKPGEIEDSKNPAFLYFSIKECFPCKEMEKVFKDEDLISSLESFNTIKIDSKDPEFEELVVKYNIQTVPSIIILSSNNKVIGGISGYVEPQDLVFYVKLAHDTNKLILIKESADQILDLL